MLPKDFYSRDRERELREMYLKFNPVFNLSIARNIARQAVADGDRDLFGMLMARVHGTLHNGIDCLPGLLLSKEQHGELELEKVRLKAKAMFCR